MKTLLILRHAKSSWKDASLSDHDRPLNKRGKRDAPRMGVLLQEEGLVPDLILSSTARRAKTTAQAAAEACGYEGELVLTRELYHAAPESYLMALQALPEAYQRVMVVGHNPGVEELLEDLTGAVERMPTAALAQVSLRISAWSELRLDASGGLVNLWLPRALA